MKSISVFSLLESIAKDPLFFRFFCLLKSLGFGFEIFGYARSPPKPEWFMCSTLIFEDVERRCLKRDSSGEDSRDLIFRQNFSLRFSLMEAVREILVCFFRSRSSLKNLLCRGFSGLDAGKEGGTALVAADRNL